MMQHSQKFGNIRMMKPSDVISALLDPAPCFVCEDVAGKAANARYRVPVVHQAIDHAFRHRSDEARGLAALARLPHGTSTNQLRAILPSAYGLGLGIIKRLADTPKAIKRGSNDEQNAAGSVIVYPPAEWDEVRNEFEQWQFDGVEEAFAELPYSFEDIVIFAGLNSSPDRWFLVLRGPMAGNVCWWTHDGDSAMNEPWADDIKAWAARLFTDSPEDLFGGVIRFSAADSLDAAPPDAQLVPIEYHKSIPDHV